MEENKEFKGWDFSYLDGRIEEEKLPWDYKSFICKYLNKDDMLLDMGTGGGEFLLSLQHPCTNVLILSEGTGLATTLLSYFVVAFSPALLTLHTSPSLNLALKTLQILTLDNFGSKSSIIDIRDKKRIVLQ